MYRQDVYRQQGGFVHPAIFNEDMIMASRVIQAGLQVAYCAGAKVIHSHSYTCMQQFHRNFDLGVSQKQYSEVFDGISSEKEGAGYASTLLVYLLKRGKAGKAFYFAMQCGFKLAGFWLGKHYDKLPAGLVRRCTMTPGYELFGK
jgi:rhamnosyltransferase